MNILFDEHLIEFKIHIEIHILSKSESVNY